MTVVDKRGRRTARAGIENQNVLIEFLYRFFNFRFALPRLLEIIPRGQIIPHRAAGRLGIWRNNADSVAKEIVPIEDILRIAGAN